MPKWRDIYGGWNSALKSFEPLVTTPGSNLEIIIDFTGLT